MRIEFTGAPTVGREPELNRLDAALETLATGSQASVAIAGGAHLDLPPGVELDLVREILQGRIAADLGPAQGECFG